MTEKLPQISLDQTDINILRFLQTDATLSLDEIAEKVSVSLNTCWRRVKRLEETGVIEKRVALLSPEKLGLALIVFVSVRTSNHSRAWFMKFSKAVSSTPQITEFYRLAGERDYLLKIVVHSIEDYDRVYQTLISQVDLADVTASFAMETIKHSTALPIK